MDDTGYSKNTVYKVVFDSVANGKVKSVGFARRFQNHRPCEIFEVVK
jgi:hypothetical protein